MLCLYLAASATGCRWRVLMVFVASAINHTCTQTHIDPLHSRAATIYQHHNHQQQQATRRARTVVASCQWLRCCLNHAKCCCRWPGFCCYRSWMVLMICYKTALDPLNFPPMARAKQRWTECALYSSCSFPVQQWTNNLNIHRKS